MKIYFLNRTHGEGAVWKSPFLPDILYGWPIIITYQSLYPSSRQNGNLVYNSWCKIPSSPCGWKLKNPFSIGVSSYKSRAPHHISSQGIITIQQMNLRLDFLLLRLSRHPSQSPRQRWTWSPSWIPTCSTCRCFSCRRLVLSWTASSMTVDTGRPVNVVTLVVHLWCAMTTSYLICPDKQSYILLFIIKNEEHFLHFFTL